MRSLRRTKTDSKANNIFVRTIVVSVLIMGTGIAWTMESPAWTGTTTVAPCPASSSSPSLEQWLRHENVDQQKHCEWLPRRVDSGFWFSDLHADPQPEFSLLSAWMKPEYPSAVKAPSEIPEFYRDGFTMGGKVALNQRYYHDQAYLGGEAKTLMWTKEAISHDMEKAKLRQPMKYGSDGLKIHGAMERYNAQVAGKRGIVVGSEDPWVEAILLHHGAEKLLTVEFGKIESEHSQVETMLAGQFTQSFLNGQVEQFDFGVSYSSLEHDGLGRYGDLLNPIGDLQSMAKMLSVIKPGGLFFIGVPTARKDALYFNAHRMYGPERLPKLLAGWKLIDIIHNKLMKGNAQHVIVIQNRNGCINQ